MIKLIYRILIIFVLFINIFNANAYAFEWPWERAKKYGEPGDYWPDVLVDAYNESGVKGTEYKANKEQENYEKVLEKAFNKIKKYNKTKLEKLKEQLEDAAGTKNGYNSPSNKYNGDEKANALLSRVTNTLRDDTINKLISGKYNEDTKSSDIEKDKAKDYVESQKEHYGEDTKIEGDKLEDTEPNGVGTLKQRDLGLATAKESTAKEYTPNEIIQGADDFLSKGKNDELTDENLQNTSNTVYNILLGVAIVLAVIIGLVLGITFMLSGAAGQAKVKEALVPYIVGCVISFSAFGIWRILIWFLNQV